MKHHHRALDSFGKNVKQQREAKGLTQEKLAEKAELDPTYISGIERGVRTPAGRQRFPQLNPQLI